MSLFNRRPKGGVRLTHETLKNCVYTVEDVMRPYVKSTYCNMCGKAHTVKTYHLHLDAAGATIVSPQVLERLKAIPFIWDTLTIQNAVKEPPPQSLGFGGPDVYRVIPRPVAASKRNRSN